MKRVLVQKVEPDGKLQPPRLVIKTAWDEWSELARHAAIGFVLALVVVGMWVVCR